MFIPAIDLKGGQVVQLVQGKRLALASDDVFAWVERFAKYPKVQVIDLDGALESGANDLLVRRICKRPALSCRRRHPHRSSAPSACSTPARRQVIVSSALFRDGQVDLDFARALAERVGARAHHRRRRQLRRQSGHPRLDRGHGVHRGRCGADAGALLRRVPLHPRRHRRTDARHRHGRGARRARGHRPAADCRRAASPRARRFSRSTPWASTRSSAWRSTPARSRSTTTRCSQAYARAPDASADLDSSRHRRAGTCAACTSDTDPESLYRWRDGLYAADLLTAALVGLDLFTWLDEQPVRLAGRSVPASAIHAAPGGRHAHALHGDGPGRARRRRVPAHDAGARASRQPLAVLSRPVLRVVQGSTGVPRPADGAAHRQARQLGGDGRQVATGRRRWPTRRSRASSPRRWIVAASTSGSARRRRSTSARRALLDIAGGSGVYACAFVAHHPHLRATVLEKPPVDAVARRAIAERGFAARVDVVAGDMLAEPLPRRLRRAPDLERAARLGRAAGAGARSRSSFAALAAGRPAHRPRCPSRRRQARPAAGRRLLGDADALHRRPLLFVAANWTSPIAGIGFGPVAIRPHRRRPQPRRRGQAVSFPAASRACGCYSPRSVRDGAARGLREC